MPRSRALPVWVLLGAAEGALLLAPFAWFLGADALLLAWGAGVGAPVVAAIGNLRAGRARVLALPAALVVGGVGGGLAGWALLSLGPRVEMYSYARALVLVWGTVAGAVLGGLLCLLPTPWGGGASAGTGPPPG